MRLNSSSSYKICTFLFFIYLGCLFWVLFKETGSTDRSTYFTERELHIIPFENTINSIKFAINNDYPPRHKTHYRYLTFRNIAGNLLLFLPFGLFCSCLFKPINNLKRVLFLTALVSFLVETFQYILILGVFDVDDIIYNTVGSCFGYHLFKPRSKYQSTLLQ